MTRLGSLAGSGLLYSGLLAALLGAATLVKPVRALRIPDRRAAAGLLALGVAAAVAGLSLPCPVVRSHRPAARIDEFVPAFQFGEHHRIDVEALPDEVWTAVATVTAAEIRMFRTLTWIRSPRWPWSRPRESILAPSAGAPILEAALRGGFIVLAEDPGRELVVGFLPCRAPSATTTQEFFALQRPGECRAAMNFLLENRGPARTRLSTETRVFATDALAQRRFRRYWRVIYPGSALIRRSWLAAIKRRAEGGGPSPLAGEGRGRRSRSARNR